jgi:acetaldehyde dehydrogenase/alcohol dehydrogenase
MNEINTLVEQALAAQEPYGLYAGAVDKIVKANVDRRLANHQSWRMPRSMNPRGVLEDKLTKNIFATEYIYHSINTTKRRRD